MSKQVTALQMLIDERAELDRAIGALQRIESGQRRRGRPPGSTNKAKPAPAIAKQKPVKRRLSPAARKRIADAQRARHAEARQEKAMHA